MTKQNVTLSNIKRKVKYKNGTKFNPGFFTLPRSSLMSLKYVASVILHTETFQSDSVHQNNLDKSLSQAGSFVSFFLGLSEEHPNVLWCSELQLNYLAFVRFPGTLLVDQAIIVVYDEQNR